MILLKININYMNINLEVIYSASNINQGKIMNAKKAAYFKMKE